MAGLNGILKTGVSGLLASQRALNTTSHNVANVNTPGFSRQSAEFSPRPAFGSGEGYIGTGVQTGTVRRVLDQFLNVEIRQETALGARASTYADLAGRLDNTLGSQGAGLSQTISDFFAAWETLSGDPSSTVARELALNEAQSLAQRIQSADRQLSAMALDVNARLRTSVSAINTLGASIAELNEDIVRNQGRFQGQPANDLLDQRDELVRQLAEYVDVSTIVQENGALNVSIASGQSLVTGTHASQLAVSTNPLDPQRLDITVSIGGADGTVITEQISGGQLAGALDFQDGALLPIHRQIGGLAVGIAEAVNERHQLGVDLTGALGRELFRDLSTTAQVLAHDANTGTATVDVRIAAASDLTGSDYLLTRNGAAYELQRLSDQTLVALANFPSGEDIVDGLALSLSAGALADGDQFLIEPTRASAADMAVLITDPKSLALGLPISANTGAANQGDMDIELSVNAPSHPLEIRFAAGGTTFDVVDTKTGARLIDDQSYSAGSSLTINGLSFAISGSPADGDSFTIRDGIATLGSNTGTGTVGPITVSNADPNLLDTVTVTFTSASTFDVVGATQGTPTAAVTFTSGDPVSFNGWTMTVTGTPAPGDTVTVSASSAPGDNRNALQLAELGRTLVADSDQATFADSFATTVSSLASITRRMQNEQEARDVLLNQLVNERESISGVNLDEEAANLLRFQQSYQANAEVIAIANETFASLLAAVGR
ncbi:MAG: flagellar hook-associated protein FlgK [Pseudomonadota bacterium]